MASFKNPLSKHPLLHYSFHLTNVDSGMSAEDVANLVKGRVLELMEHKFGINVLATEEDIEIGGMFGKKSQPGIVFKFADHPEYARELVGFNKVGNVVEINSVQYGACSPAMARMNSANSKGSFSITGMIQKAVTNVSAVEEEELAYSSIILSIEEAVESLTE